MGGTCSTHGEIRNAYEISVGKPEGKYHVEDLGVDGRIILERILGKLGGEVWIGFIWLGIWASGGLL
jgi:hypothetical protein